MVQSIWAICQTSPLQQKCCQLIANQTSLRFSDKHSKVFINLNERTSVKLHVHVINYQKIKYAILYEACKLCVQNTYAVSQKKFHKLQCIDEIC